MKKTQWRWVFGVVTATALVPACSSGDDDSKGPPPGGVGGTTATGGTTSTGGTSGTTSAGTAGSGGVVGVGGTTGTIGAGTSGAPANSGASQAHDEALSDSQILELALAATRAATADGRIAAARARSSDVGDFAERVLRDHVSASDGAQALSAGEGIPPAASTASLALDAQAAVTADVLTNASDADFDRTYMDLEVMAHEQTLGLLEQTLAPQAVDAALRAYLASLQSAVQRRLDRARAIDDAW